MKQKSRTRLGFFDRTITAIQRRTVVNALRAWNEITGTARAFTGAINPDVPKQDTERLVKQMTECLDPKGGEVTARHKAIELGHTYLSLTDKGKERFFKVLATEFDIDRKALAEKISLLSEAKDSAAHIKLELGLREALEPSRLKILRQFNALPQGIKFLVDMRADLLRLKRTDSTLSALETDLRKLLASWFDIGLLDLQEITWNSPASLLEKLIAYEAVHAIRSWEDLKNRLDSDRRCFAFFHYKMPGEPLIFVEVALANGIADNIQLLLDETQPSTDSHKADTAVFYSISNAQAGLAGISFGNFLIKRVVDKLSAELGNVKHFVTLSPIPGFRAWLDPQLKTEGKKLLSAAEEKQLGSLVALDNNASLSLYKLLETNWAEDAKTATILQPILMRLCAHYLLEEKKNGRPLDPVAHFHLSNGSRMERLNWLADTSRKGMKHSAGMMVNYYYQLSKIEDNHEAYSTSKMIVASNGVRGLLKK